MLSRISAPGSPLLYNQSESVYPAANHLKVKSSGAIRFRISSIAKSMPLYKKWLEKTPQAFQEMRKEIDKSPDPIYYGAPVIVFVIGKGMTADFDCAIACQNMMLAARSMGIGSCWVYIGQLVLQESSVRERFMISEGEKVYGE